MSYRLACSGTVTPSDGINNLIDDALDEVERRFGPPELLVSGAAHGVDTEWIFKASTRWAGTMVLLCVPQAPYNDTIYQKLLQDGVLICVIGAPHGNGMRGHSDAYMKRNDLIQESADVLVAHPESKIEQLYSGTWSTVRRFRKAKKPILIAPDVIGAKFLWER